MSGLTIAAKDLYDVEGHVTGCGNPEWAATHAPAISTAPAIQALLDAGARLVGKTHMDELAYSLNGENARYGTPVNPACPGRVPGGSSSGSAVAAANGSVDIALGSDTGGSVRVPASYCGILGLRPTHGRVSLEGACPLAPSYDTGGFFARDAETLQAAAGVLLDPATRRSTHFKRLLVAKDAFAAADASATDALYQALRPAAPALQDRFGGLPEVELGGGEAKAMGAWADTFRVSQGFEVWRALGAWVTEQRPAFGMGIAERFQMASRVTPKQAEEATEQRRAITARLDELLGGDAAVLLPSAPGPAPRLRTPPGVLDAFRRRLLTLTSPAGLGGLPQVSLPIATVDGCPLGLGVMGPRGSDEDLLELAAHILALLQHPAA
ncbi:hypothetical protein WJX81_008525 [Elliptochloris bilobata]|uniref:Amidase domain-containing protein n=1 Tax=Elliptochloris bilobata TaxID=381761 RepID=A0AAW1QYE5_9CHLO